MKDVVLHCSIFFKWNKLVRVRVRVREVNELKRQLNDREQRKTEHNKSLILGRSIIRNTNEKKTWQQKYAACKV